MAGLVAPLLLPIVAFAVDTGPRTVPRDEIIAVMQAHRGYDPAVTANGARFQTEVLLDLLQAHSEGDRGEPYLFVDHADWFAACLARSSLQPDQAPAFMRLANDYSQDMVVDARPGRVVERVLEGRAPRMAANVIIGWAARPGGKGRYTYEDTRAIPKLKVTNERMITYRLLDFGDMVAYDDIDGVRGRPTEGFLGFLFDVIGEGSIQWSRMAISPDGLQISHARAAKGPFRVESTLTVFPDGRIEKDLPKDRPDLAPLERRLLQPLKIRYKPLDRQHAPSELRPTGS